MSTLSVSTPRPAVAPAMPFKGNDRLLFGMIMGVIAFWLFAQTTLNIAPAMQQDLGLDANLMNIAVAVTALFSGMFIVVMGGLADRIGRVRIMTLGFVFSIIGALLIALAPTGPLAIPALMLGRAIQGVSAACIMPASLALVKTYWDGADRQRAVSMWSIGSWGGSGVCALFGTTGPGDNSSAWGGGGGGWGAKGGDGYGGGGGGGGGSAVVGDSNITWINTGTRYGAIT